MEIDKMSGTGNVRFRVHSKRQQAQSINSLWEPAISLFVRDKYVTPTGKRLHAGYVQKAEAAQMLENM